MRTAEFTSKRLVLSKEEKHIAKSWGALWSRFGQLERSGRPIRLIFGDWSGYRSSQYRITHVAFLHDKSVESTFSGTVQFTDNTTMNVWVKEVTREEIINNKWEQRTGYTKLIGDLIRSGKTYYKVGDQND